MTATSLDLSQIKTDALSSGDTFRSLIGLGDNDSAAFSSVDLTGGTVTTSTPLLDATQTWNSAGTVFTGLKLNVTDTASDSSSLLMDLQVGGSRKFGIYKNGAIQLNDTYSTGGHRIISDNTGFAFTNANQAKFGMSGGFQFFWTYLKLGFTPTSTSLATAGNATDLILERDAANTLAQRNSTNPQTFRLYNTYTDASNYERGFLKWNSNVLEIGAEASGTGVQRNAKISTNLSVIAPNGTVSGGYTAFGETLRVERSDNSVINIVSATNRASHIYFSDTALAGHIQYSHVNDHFDFRVQNNSRLLLSNTESSTSLTWNDAGTVFTGLKLNVTDTASDASSLLMDLQVGGSSKFRVDKNGYLFSDKIYGKDGTGDANITFGSFSFNFNDGGNLLLNLNTVGLNLPANMYLGFSDTAGVASTIDTVLRRDAADTLAQRRSTNPQTFRIYNTYTDASNYERGFIKWDSNTFTIGPESTAAIRYTKIFLDSSGYSYWQGGTDGYTPSLTSRYGAEISFGNAGLNVLRKMMTIGSNNYSPRISYSVQPSKSGNFGDSPTYNGWLSGNYGGSYSASSNRHNGTGWSVWCGYGATPTDENADGGNAGNFDVWLNAGGAGAGTGITGASGKFRVVNDSDSDSEVFSINNSGFVTLTPSVLTGSSATSAIDIAQTWNTTGTPTLIKANVTDTASNASSLLMDLQVGGSSRFRVAKNGTFVFGSSSVETHTISTNRANSAILGLSSDGGGSWWLGPTTGYTIRSRTGAGTAIDGRIPFGFSPTSATYDNIDTRLYRDDADTLAQRRSTNPQTFRIYNTYTDASNYERGKLEWSSNIFRIGTEKAGTGIARTLELQANGTTRLSISSSNVSIPYSWGSNSITFSPASGASIGHQLIPFLFNSKVSGDSSITKSRFIIEDTNIGGSYSSFFGIDTALNGSLVRCLTMDGNLVAFGSLTSSFPAIKRNTTELNFRLADDSADCNITAAALTLSGNLTISTKDIVTDTTTGTKIGTATTQKLGFYNATPVVQPTAVADATDAASAITQLNALLSRVRDLGLIAT